jgi:hypothetical protein
MIKKFEYQYHTFRVRYNDESLILAELDKLGEDGWLLVSKLKELNAEDFFKGLFMREVHSKMFNIGDLPKLPQRQDSTTDQMRDLYDVANKLGLHDAADCIREHFLKNYI